jgi:hypothetical protein
MPRLQRERDVAEDLLLVERKGHVVEHDDRPPGTERLVEQRRADCLFERHQ